MLTRIYIDNFRCFVNFEYRPAQRQLILGPNGSGKSSLLDALLFLRRVVVLGHDLERRKVLAEKTLWMNQPKQTFELEASLDEAIHIYKLVIDSYGDPPRARIISESVKFNGKPIFEFEDGKVQLFDDKFQSKVVYPFDWHRSALALVTDIRDNQKLIRFKHWFENLLGFRINPFQIKSQTEDEDSYPYFDLRNFPAWYRHLVQAERKEDSALMESLRAALDGFRFLKLQRTGENMRSLAVEFESGGVDSIELGLSKLSDGQRCLIGLYTIVHFVLSRSNTVILDEPDNFIALREIQPWLSAISDAIDQSRGQVIIISHHPELMNQWAPDFGVQFIRENLGPVRVKEFSGKAYDMLRPSDIVARGWEND
jgi:predicted ATPase